MRTDASDGSVEHLLPALDLEGHELPVLDLGRIRMRLVDLGVEQERPVARGEREASMMPLDSSSVVATSPVAPGANRAGSNRARIATLPLVTSYATIRARCGLLPGSSWISRCALGVDSRRCPGSTGAGSRSRRAAASACRPPGRSSRRSVSRQRPPPSRVGGVRRPYPRSSSRSRSPPGDAGRTRRPRCG